MTYFLDGKFGQLLVKQGHPTYYSYFACTKSLSSILQFSRLPFEKNVSCLPLEKHGIVFHLQKNEGLLPFTQKLRLSSIYQKMEVIFHLHKKVRSSSILSLTAVKLRTWVLTIPWATKSSQGTYIAQKSLAIRN